MEPHLKRQTSPRTASEFCKTREYVEREVLHVFLSVGWRAPGKSTRQKGPDSLSVLVNQLALSERVTAAFVPSAED